MSGDPFIGQPIRKALTMGERVMERLLLDFIVMLIVAILTGGCGL